MAPRPEDKYQSLLANRQKQGRLRQLTTSPPRMVDLSSNDYLSLSGNPHLLSSYLGSLQDAHAGGTLSLGSRGSRLLDGNSPATEALEQEVASFHGAPAGLLFNSGYEANVGLFGCAPQKGDVVVYDELIHASVHDGMRLGRAKNVPFRHNSIWTEEPEGALQSLNNTLLQVTSGESGKRIRDGEAMVFVAVESVYSMDGDVLPLQDVIDCVKLRLPLGNGHIIVDEAHSTGWMGDQGRGLVSHLEREDSAWARVHTFGKGMGCSGAIVLCSPLTRAYLINYARTFIYTTAMGVPAIAAIRSAYRFLKSEQAQRAVMHLRHLIRYMHEALVSLISWHLPPRSLFRIYEKPPGSPIIPIFSSQARGLAEYARTRGFVMRPIVAPTVPAGTERVRVCLHAGNSAGDLDLFCGVISSWLRLQMDAERSTIEAPDGLSQESSKL